MIFLSILWYYRRSAFMLSVTAVLSPIMVSINRERTHGKMISGACQSHLYTSCLLGVPKLFNCSIRAWEIFIHGTSCKRTYPQRNVSDISCVILTFLRVRSNSGSSYPNDSNSGDLE